MEDGGDASTLECLCMLTMSIMGGHYAKESAKSSLGYSSPSKATFRDCRPHKDFDVGEYLMYVGWLEGINCSSNISQMFLHLTSNISSK